MLSSVALLGISLAVSVAFDITLPNGIPTEGCNGDPAATMTLTTKIPMQTGFATALAGDYWKQEGAVWELAADQDTIQFTKPGIPGAGAGYGDASPVPDEAIDALLLNDNKATITFKAPSPAVESSWQFMFAVGTPEEIEKMLQTGDDGSESETGGDAPTWNKGDCKVSSITDSVVTCDGKTQEPKTSTATVCACPSDKVLVAAQGDDPCSAYTNAGHASFIPNACPKAKRDAMPLPTPPPGGAQVGARMRRAYAALHPREDGLNMVINAKVPCLKKEDDDNKSTPVGKTDKAVASLCANNKIEANAEAWTTYEVPKYMASLISHAVPDSSPTDTVADVVDGAETIAKEVNNPGGKCSYDSKCDAIDCNSVPDADSGSLLPVQQFLAFNAVANLNNFLNAIYEAVFKGGIINALGAADIVNTFFENPTPDATWMQILGVIGPILGIISAALGPVAALTSAALGAASGVVGLIGAGGTLANLAAVADARFDEFAKITDFIQNYLEATAEGIKIAYEETIGPQVDKYEWTGSNLAPEGWEKQGIFGSGAFANAIDTQKLSENMLDNFVSVIAFKAINWAWIDSGAFIIYVPYGRTIMGPDGDEIENFSKDYCENELKQKDMVGKLVNCDVDGGMAGLLNAGGGETSGDLKSPKNYDKEFHIYGDMNFKTMDAIAGSVASWKAGDFGYDIGTPFGEFGDNGPSAEQLQQIGKLDFSATAAGIFNISVCQTFDLRFFPFAQDDWEMTPCTACDSSVAVGGKDTNVKFWDKTTDVVKATLGNMKDFVCQNDKTKRQYEAPRCERKGNHYLCHAKRGTPMPNCRKEGNHYVCLSRRESAGLGLDPGDCSNSCPSEPYTG